MSAQPIPLQVPRPEPPTPAPKKQRAHTWVVALLPTLAIAAVAGWYTFEQRGITVQTISPQYADIENTISSNGTVVPVNDFPARAAFSGQVQKIYVHVGDKVRPGQMLLELKDQYALPRLRNAIADLQTSELTLQNLQNNGSQEDRIGFAADLKRAQAEREDAAGSLNTIKQLNQRGSASDDEVQAAMRRLQSADAALDAIQKRTQQRYSATDVAGWKDRVLAGQANVAAERASWANAHVTSPIAGTVYLRPVSLYDFVSAGSDLLHVADLSHLEVRSDFYEPDIGDLHIGAPVKISWEGAPGRIWNGHIISKPMAVDHNGSLSTGTCVIALDSPLADLPVNAGVSVVITKQRHEHALTIPRTAIYTQAGMNFVYRVFGNRLKKTPVIFGLVNATEAEITSGLVAGDVIALRASNNQPLHDDLRVTTSR